MKLARLNLLTSCVSLLGSIVILIFVHQALSVLIWVGASIVWLLIGLYQMGRGNSQAEQFPGRRIMRRLSRLLLFG